MATKPFIYGLVCPISNEIRYIGKSDNPRKRLQEHLDERRRNHRGNWIQSLRAQGLAPTLIILEETDTDLWQECERWHIAAARAQGHRLTNQTNGGEGGGILGRVLSATTRERIAAALRGRKRSPAANEKITAYQRQKRVSDVTRQRISEARKGIQFSEETIEKLRHASTGNIQSDESLAKRSKRVLQYDLDGNFIQEWPSVNAVERAGISHAATIIACCKGKYRQAGGFIWRYA
jgi:hypothetical protein